MDYQQLYEGLETERTSEPSLIIIFGASGNLTKRKLMPALYNLFCNGFIPEGSKIVGVSRSFADDNNFRDTMKEAIYTSGIKNEKNNFYEILYHIKSEFQGENSYNHLKNEIERLEKSGKTCGNRIYYLATPPEYFSTIIENLGKIGMNRPKSGTCWTRIIIEKPFGRDLESAKQLNIQIGQTFKEDQIYRIDHYLGKETVQNLLVFRFGNSIFEPIWNRNYIDHIQITAAETIGIEGRGNYYDKAGALRDMVPNHLFQLLALIAMEPPVTFEADVVREEKVQVLKAIPPFSGESICNSIVRGQYGNGRIEGKEVPSYHKEKDVPPDSKTETFTALKLFIQNWRWAGVPFYIRTGKRMPEFVTDINLFFRKTPHMIFRMMSHDDYKVNNVLSIQIQPDESITLRFNAKEPGAGMTLKPVVMDFDYNSAFGTTPSNAYERLLRDCLSGDQTLYMRRDAIEEAWAIIDNVLKEWGNEKNTRIPMYESGSWGPKEADELLEKDGRKWKNIS